MSDFKPVLRFIASSDIHYNREDLSRLHNYEKGLALAYEYAASQDYNKIDALYVVGDFADSGSEEQFNDFRKTLDTCIRPETKWMLTMASHEYFSEDGEEGALKRLKEIMKQEPDNHIVINGFHFISVTTTRGCKFSDEKREWIKKELAAAAADDPFKPIFFFQHPHIQGTVYGNVYWGEDEITDILMNYPQIIDFSGHSHAPVNDPRSIHQQHFTCVGTGSFKYFELDEFDKVYGTVPPNEQNAAQFIIVEADAAGKVVIRPYDVITERFFGYEWTVETPWEPDSFTYTDERYLTDVRPYFALDAALELTVDGNSVNVKFDQAKIEEDRINDYKVTVRRKSDNAIVKQVCFWSRYYLNDMPATVEQKITELDAGEYIAEITAQGFWKNKSINKLCGEFTIK